MYVVFVLVAAAVACAVAVVATGRGGGLGEAAVDRPVPVLPEGPLTPADLHDVRFPLAVRGYRMDQVDAVLDRVADELAERDALIERLRADLVGQPAAPAAPATPAEPAQ